MVPLFERAGTAARPEFQGLSSGLKPPTEGLFGACFPGAACCSVVDAQLGSSSTVGLPQDGLHGDTGGLPPPPKQQAVEQTGSRCPQNPSETFFPVCPSAEVPSCHSVYLRQDGYLAHANRTEGTEGPRDPLLLTLNGC